MKKIVTVDLDGTLLNNSNEIIGGEKTKNLIKKLQDKGFEFIINTGRLDHDILKVANAYDLPKETRLSQNGAVIVHNNTLDATLLDKAEAREVWNFLQRLEGLRIELNTVSNRYWLEDRSPGFVRELFASEKIVDEYDSIIDYQPIVLFLVIGDREPIATAREYIEANFNKLYPVQTSANSLEILPNGVSKGIGLRKMFAEDVIFAVGDSENDYSIFDVADQSYLIGTGKYEKAVNVKDIAEALELILTSQAN